MKLPHTFVTFRDIRQYEISNLTSDQPACFNGDVCVRKFRVTIEEVREPDDVIAARIRDLWETCDNHHHWQPLRNAAKKVGLTLDMKDCGKRKVKR